LQWYRWQPELFDTNVGFLGFILLFVGGFLGGFVCVAVAALLEVDSAAARLSLDKRPPVLYLRSFKSDRGIFRTSLVGERNSRKSMERSLAETLARVGPVIAIGRPGERFAMPGAAKMYVKDDEWQQVVLGLVRRSAAVVLVLGETRGLEWETGAVVHNADARRVLLVVPAQSLKQYERYCAMADRNLPHPLPRRLWGRGEKIWPPVFFTFGDDWSPSHAPSVVRRFPNDFRRSVDYDATLLAFIERLGLLGKPFATNGTSD
jgi:hypothetical protein